MAEDICTTLAEAAGYVSIASTTRRGRKVAKRLVGLASAIRVAIVNAKQNSGPDI